MNITQEETGDNLALVHIQLTEEDYAGKVSSKLKDYRKKANMPGFRPGMVPMGMIKKMYGQSVLANEVNELISEGINNHIKDNELKLLGNPLPNTEKSRTLDFDNQKEFDFYFDIALSPEIDLEINDQISVPYYKITVGNDEIEKAVKSLLNKNAEAFDEETVEKDSHVAVTIHQVDAEGNIVSGGHYEDIDFDINEIASEEQQKLFIGQQKEAKIQAVPAELFGTKEKASPILKEAGKKDELLNNAFAFEISGIHGKKLPELNEEFYKKLYPEEALKTEEEFKNRLKKDIEAQHEIESDNQLLNEVTEKLIESTDITLPDEFLKRWLLENGEGKITKEQVEEQYESYSKTAKWQLIEAKLRKEFPDELAIDEEDIRDDVRRYFFKGDIPEEKDAGMEQIVDQILSSPKEKERIGQAIMGNRYIRLFKEKITKEEQEVTFEQFIEMISKQKSS